MILLTAHQNGHVHHQPKYNKLIGIKLLTTYNALDNYQCNPGIKTCLHTHDDGKGYSKIWIFLSKQISYPIRLLR